MRGPSRLFAVVVAALLVAGGCGGDDSAFDDLPSATADAESDLRGRLDELQRAVTDWTGASTIEEAHAAAETAANLVVGPNGPGFGDRDGNGSVEGETAVGLLSGFDDTPTGIAAAAASSECLGRDVLGSTAGDANAGWSEMEAAIEAWRPNNNTMPSLASHPMRIVGWATFTQASTSLEEAHEYAGHAQLHVDVALAALDC